MIYAEILGLVLRFLGRSILINQGKKVIGSMLASDPMVNANYVLQNDFERQTVLQMLRLMTASQFHYLNSNQSEGALPLSSILDHTSSVEDTFKKKKSVSTVDAYVSNWMNAVVDTYMSTIAPVWLKSLHQVADLSNELKPHAYQLISDYSDPFTSLPTLTSSWAEYDKEYRETTLSSITFSRIRAVLLEDEDFKDYLKNILEQGIPSSSYLPFKMLSIWSLFTDTVRVKFDYINKRDTISQNPLIPLGFGNAFSSHHRMPAAESKVDWDKIMEDLERKRAPELFIKNRK